MPDYLDADGNFDREAWLDAEVRPERNIRLDAADARVRRFENQYHAGLETTENVATLQRIREYMQALRDFPKVAIYGNLVWPEVP